MNTKRNRPIIGISIGDIHGIGVEVTMKALLDSRVMKSFIPVIYAHGKVLTFYRKLLNLEEFNFMQIKTVEEAHPKKINLINVVDDCPEIIPGVETVEAGKLALAALDHAIKDLKANRIHALVTAPLNKNNINPADSHFIGHTEYLTSAFGSNKSMMFMVGEDIKVGLVTGHMPLKDVPAHVTDKNIREKLEVMLKSLKDDFGINKPKVAILGLNPHAGEGGLLGMEEAEIILPIVNEYKNKGILVLGPFPSDGFFGMMHQKKFDGVLAMYHDQGLIPFKSFSFSSGVNYTAGLPIIRTSPDHGTAYDIAGKNVADEGSMRASLFLAYDILSRKENLG